ncbi:MAG: tetratricopeptide repeat protein [Thermomicrobiales bacterium]
MAVDRSQPFGVLLKSLRQRADLTQEELAEKAGLSARAVSDLERQCKQPYKTTAEMLANGLGLSGEDRIAFVAARRQTRGLGDDNGGRRRVVLPVPPNTLIGREREVRDACALLSQSAVRLLTLTGPGGVGKTRLALAVAEELADHVAQVRLIALESIDDPALVTPLICHALGVRETRETPSFDALRDALQDTPTLLVLDNVEHLAGIAPDLANILSLCPKLTILATSRAALRLRAEHAFPVEPLALAAADDSLADGDLTRYPALALFIARAQAVVPWVATTDGNAALIAQICARLDGLPLAIELAAPLLRVLSLKGLLARLDRNLGLLAHGPHDAPARQQTMYATIAWSYDLLLPGEQHLFRRLAVLKNGFTLDAAAALAPRVDPAQPEIDILPELAALVEKHLLRRLNGDDEPRFGMLESIREFGLTQLRKEGEAEAAHRAHADYFAALAETIQPFSIDTQPDASLDVVAQEYDNLRAVLAWTLDRGERETAVRVTGSLVRFWYLRGSWTEGRTWLERALMPPRRDQTLAFARSHLGAGVLAEAQGEFEAARGHYATARDVFQALDHQAGLCRVLNNLGNVLGGLNQLDEAREQYERALATCRGADETQGIAEALQNLGIVAALRGQHDVAAPLFAESLVLFRRIGDRFGIRFGLTNLASLAFRAGDLDRARARCRDALVLTAGIHDPQGEAAANLVLGDVALQRGEFGIAERHFSDALAVCEELGDVLGEASAVAGLGAIAFRGEGDRPLAVRLLQEALTGFDHLHEQEQMAWCLDELAHVMARCERGALAARLLAAAETLRETIDVPLAPVYQPGHDRILGEIRSTLGEAAFHAEWDAGKTMAIGDLVASAAADATLGR